MSAVPPPTRSLRDGPEQPDRHRAVVSTALRLVVAEGLGALTMQRLADEAGCGIGSLYRRFPSKDALLAELQCEALEAMAASFERAQGHLDDHLRRRGIDEPEVVALARAVAAARFWVTAEADLPQEVALARRLLTDPALADDEDALGRVLPSALRLLDLVARLLDRAATTGALRPGPSGARAVVLLAGTTGVLMASALGRMDGDDAQGRGLAALLVDDLFLGWGAPADSLTVVDELVAGLVESGQLVPRTAR